MCPVARGASVDAICLARLCGCGWWLCQIVARLGYYSVPGMGALKLVRLSGETMVKRKITIKNENFFLRLLLLIHEDCYLAAMTSVGTLE
jgi:hypothetical protein